MTALAVFLDRDGVINSMVYNSSSGLWTVPPEVPDQAALPMAPRPQSPGSTRARSRSSLFPTTGDLAKGKLSTAQLEAVTNEIRRQLGDTVWLPPTASTTASTIRPGSNSLRSPACDCRKPAPGLLRQAAQDLGITLIARVIDDGVTDIAAAWLPVRPRFSLRRPSRTWRPPW